MWVGTPRVTLLWSDDDQEEVDEVLDCACEYGLGCMTGLAGHVSDGGCSSSSFGRSGIARSSFAFAADAERELAAAVVRDGIVDAGSSSLRRPVDIRAIDADVDGSDCGLLAERVPQPTACLQRRISRRPVPV